MGGDARQRDRDDREAIEVDRLIRRLQPARASGRHPVLSRNAAYHAGVAEARIPMRAGAVRACVILGVLLGVAVPQWPYARACGWWLLLYLFAVEMIVIAGIWGARLTWQRRLGFTHTLALATILWGLILTAHEVLPRVGYARAQAIWFCAH